MGFNSAFKGLNVTSFIFAQESRNEILGLWTNTQRLQPDKKQVITCIIHQWTLNCIQRNITASLLHILGSVTVFLKSCLFQDNVEKILQNGSGHRWQFCACALHARYLRLKYTARICDTYCLSAATTVAWTHRNFTVHVRCLLYLHCFIHSTQSLHYKIIKISTNISRNELHVTHTTTN